MYGRFAPSPTSDLHVGNLRTAVASWLMARTTGRGHLVRIEDLDAARVAAAPQVAARQLADLAAVGIDWDGQLLVQSQRTDAYAAALQRLDLYECFCTRREIAEAASAPHADDGHRPYPGTCLTLTDAERTARRAFRAPALRVRAAGARVTIADRWAGPVTASVDDFVVRRNDGAYAYNLAVVVDDLASDVTQVVRGDDLLSSSPRQAWLARALGGAEPEYAHVGLVVNDQGRRLAKRDGAVTLADRAARGESVAATRTLLAASLGLCRRDQHIDLATLRSRFDPSRLPRTPWCWNEPGATG